ncbi:MupA/Atu3671 family FMN-dependent luciferase-like monooxygenase [Streptomyces sp. NPDC015220]|uniref:MupA/Atu3671 family FMN-dependent luciferase-like monooxygenase n=1 Tax=Streptomyces sp. NPDC015220 TaxID=3364947 RepID=UPI0036FEF3A7
MDFSLFYFANDSNENETDRYQLLLEGAKFADRNGFSAVWTPERHFHPFGGLYPNPAVTGAAVAAVTERIEIRAGSVVSPLHHPLRIAEEWSVVDNISGGRAGISFASGWNAADFVLAPGNYEDRRTLVREHVEQVRALWRGETMSLTDGVGTQRDVAVYPRPVRQRLPVWVTSAGSVETFRAAGRLGAGVLTHLLGQEPDELAGKITAYREALAERPGHDGWNGHVALMVHTFVGDDEAEVKELVRAPLSDYLRSSLGLLLGARYDGARMVDPKKLSAADTEFIVGRAFDRYFETGGLLGTVDKAARTAADFAALGVDEAACLIDFGLPTKAVLAGLDPLDEVRKRIAAGSAEGR